MPATVLDSPSPTGEAGTIWERGPGGEGGHLHSFTPPPVQKGGLPRGVELPDSPPDAETLLHFSENPDITIFMPKPVNSNPDSEPLVWTIDEKHAPLYYFPRDCPRICYWALPTSTPEDIERFLTLHTGARMVIAIESAWLERMRTTTVYAYRFASDDFVSLRDHGVHVTRQTVKPLSVEPVGDLLTRLAESGVELRITPSLGPLRRALLSATLHFSMIRMRNAQPEEENTPEKI